MHTRKEKLDNHCLIGDCGYISRQLVDRWNIDNRRKINNRHS